MRYVSGVLFCKKIIVVTLMGGTSEKEKEKEREERFQLVICAAVQTTVVIIFS